MRVCVITVILFLFFYIPFRFFFHSSEGGCTYFHVCNTALDVMKAASVSPARDLCNYRHFRKTAYNYEVKKHHCLDFLTSHPDVYIDIWVLCTAVTRAPWEEGVEASCGAAFCSRGEFHHGPHLHIQHTHSPL